MNNLARLPRTHPLNIQRYGPVYLEWLVPVLWIVGFLGYQTFLMGVIGSGIGAVIGSTKFSIAYRLLTISIGLVVANATLSKLKLNLPSGFIISLATFVMLYSLRVFYEAYVTQSISAFEYIGKVHGAAFLPMLAFLYPMSRKNSKYGFWGLVFVGFTAVMIILVLYRDHLGVSYRSIRYIAGVNKDSLVNAHKISYTGAIVSSLCVWGLIAFWKKLQQKHKLVLIVILVPSVMMMFFGGSRGALVAFVATVISFLVSQGKVDWSKIFAAGFVGGVVYLVSSQLTSSEGGFGLMSRMLHVFNQVASGSDEAGSGRFGLWTETLKQIAGSPLWGSGIVEKQSDGYPHNHILEAFMATGVLGGAAFVALCYYGLKSAKLLLKVGGGYAWVGILFVFYFVEGLFSAPIYQYHFWFALCASVSLAAQLHKAKNSR